VDAKAIPNAVVWLNPDQVDLVREVAAVAGFEIVAAGSPARGQGGAVAAALGVPAESDLRYVLAERQASLVFIATPGEFGTDNPEGDASSLLTAKARGTKVASLEPIPARALDLSAAPWVSDGTVVGAAEAIRFVPMLRHSRAMREAADVIANFGVIRSVSVEQWGRACHGSIGAHLYSALDAIQSLLGEPEVIDATVVSSGFTRGIHALPGETLRELSGDMNAILRFADGRAASIATSDHAGRWNRGVTLVGDSGRLRLYDDGFEWINANGEKADETRFRRPARGVTTADHAVAAIADAIKRVLDPAIPDVGPADLARVLPTAQAALLSARTGQPESPTTIRRMIGAA